MILYTCVCYVHLGCIQIQIYNLEWLYFISIYTCIYKCRHTYTCRYIFIYRHVCPYTIMHIHMHAHVCVFIQAYINTCIRVYLYGFIDTCIYLSLPHALSFLYSDKFIEDFHVDTLKDSSLFWFAK